MSSDIAVLQKTLEERNWLCARFDADVDDGYTALAATRTFVMGQQQDEITIDVLANGTAFVHTSMLCVKLHPHLVAAIIEITKWRGW